MSNTKARELEERQQPLVLIVDDEESICATLADVLEDENFSTITAHNGPQAISLLEEHRPQLVFLDIWMPGLDGLSLLGKIKERLPLTEVIMISGHSTIANALEASKRGAFDFIEKPLNIDDIVLSATRALEKRERELELHGEEQLAGTEEEVLGQTRRSELPILTHRGVLSRGQAGENIGQRTLKKSVILYGQGLHSGEKSGLVLEPLPLNSGIHFGKIGSSQTVPAFVDYVDSTHFATTVRSGRVSAGTVEHLMSALHAYRITNLLVKSNNEIPIFDGSASEFCTAIENAGIEEQGGDWYELSVSSPLSIKVGKNGGEEESISVEPADTLTISYELNYPAPVGRQSYEVKLGSVEDFKREIAPARTFGFLKDIEQLQRAGLAAGGRLDNFILIDKEKIVNTELRFADELVRHKILDIMGDLFLLGRPWRAKITACMSGHSDNATLLKQLLDKALE